MKSSKIQLNIYIPENDRHQLQIIAAKRMLDDPTRTYTAAGIAEADAIQTAKEASIQALPLWIFPFLLLRDNLFLGMGTETSVLIINLLMIMLGVLVFTVAVNRYWVERIPKQWTIVLYVLTIAIMQPISMTISFISCLIGIGILGLLYFNKNKKQIAL